LRTKGSKKHATVLPGKRTSVADPGGANPAMAPPSNLAIEFGPPLRKNKCAVLKNILNNYTLIMISFTYNDLNEEI
jgi:hypothetical protein